MFYFPKRPIDKRGFYRRRSWSSDIPFYDNVVCHYKADECYVDGENFAVPCSPGDLIGAVRNSTDYAGLHALAVLPSFKMSFVIDSGFPAIFTGTAGTYYKGSNARILRTAEGVALSMHVAVFRSTTATWGNHGAFLGSFNSHTRRSHLTLNSGTRWSDPPITIQRKNGVNFSPGQPLGNITSPLVLVFGDRFPSDVIQREIGTATDTNNSNSYNAGLYIYELLGFSSILAVDEIEKIENYLMDKYGI